MTENADHYPNGSWPNLRAFLEEIDKRNDARFAGHDRFDDHRFQVFQAKLDERDLRLQQRFEAQEIAVKDALAAAKEVTASNLLAMDRATVKAEIAADNRFTAVNEFRAQLADQAQTFLPRAEWSANHNSLEGQIAAVGLRFEEKLEAVRGNVEALTHTQAGDTGERKGVSQQTALLISILSPLVGIITAVVIVFVH